MRHQTTEQTQPHTAHIAPTYFISGRPGPNDRAALAPGHPVSWGSITEGTILDGATYPYPIFAP